MAREGKTTRNEFKRMQRREQRRNKPTGNQWPPSFTFPNAVWKPQDAFASGELGMIRLPGVENSCFTDIAKATPITDFSTNPTIGSEQGQSPNNVIIRQITAAKRPAAKILPASSRRVIDYTVAGTETSIGVPSMGSSCTLLRARPGIGASITPNVTINGTQLVNTNIAAEMLINRALTAGETTLATIWFNQASGQADEFNLSYGSDPAMVLDWYHQMGHAKRPIIVYVHGGGWRNGDKLLDNSVSFKNQHFLPLGYDLVSVNYPMAIGTTPVQEAHSVAQALAYVQQRCVSQNRDPRNLILMGHSAGANIIGQVNASQALCDAHGVYPWLCTVMIDSAAYDVVSIMTRDHVGAIYDEPFGTDPQLWKQASPYWLLDRAPPPTFMITSTTTNPGEADNNVGPYQIAVTARGGYAEIYHTDFDHGGTNSELGKQNQYTTDVQAFIDKCLNGTLPATWTGT